MAIELQGKSRKMGFCSKLFFGAMCSESSSMQADSFSFQNRQLLVEAKMLYK